MYMAKSISKKYLRFLIKSKLVNKKDYQSDKEVKTWVDRIIKYCEENPQIDYKQFLTIYILNAMTGGSEELSFEIYNLKIEARELNEKMFNWKDVDSYKIKSLEICNKLNEPLKSAILKEFKFTKYRSSLLFFYYTLLSIPFTIIAALFLAYAIYNSIKNNIVISNEYMNGIRGGVSLLLVIPLIISNKLYYSIRNPKFHLSYIPFLVILGFILFLIYMGFYEYFLFFFLHTNYTITIFSANIINHLRSEWLYTVPLGVILINLFLHSRILILPDFLSEFLSGLDDFNDFYNIGYLIKFFIIYVPISILLSLIIKAIIYII